MLFKDLLSHKKPILDVQKSRRSISVLASFCQDLPAPLDVYLALRRGSALKKIGNPQNLIESHVVLIDRLDEPLTANDMSDSNFTINPKSQPVLECDLFWDEWQIYAARARGIDSITIWADLLDVISIQYLIEVCRELGMEPVVIVHNKPELDEILKTDARLIQLGSKFSLMNQDLKTSFLNGKSLIKYAEKKSQLLRRIWIAGDHRMAPEEELYKAGFSSCVVHPESDLKKLVNREIRIHV